MIILLFNKTIPVRNGGEIFTKRLLPPFRDTLNRLTSARKTGHFNPSLIFVF